MVSRRSIVENRSDASKRSIVENRSDASKSIFVSRRMSYICTTCMTNELTFLRGLRLSQLRAAAMLFYGYRLHDTIHQVKGVHMHWVIFGMESEYQALGTNYKIRQSHIAK